MTNYTEATPTPWGLFQLAPDEEAYGEDALKWVIVAGEDGTIEVTGIVENYHDAELIVDAVNNYNNTFSEVLGNYIDEMAVYLFGPNYVADLDYEEVAEKLLKWITYTFKEYSEDQF